MDALARLEPVARPLLRRGGRRPGHPRRAGRTPGLVAAAHARHDPGRRRRPSSPTVRAGRAAADRRRARRPRPAAYDELAAVRGEVAVGGRGRPRRTQTQVGALGDHLAAPTAEASLQARAAATASYLEDTADWFSRGAGPGRPRARRGPRLGAGRDAAGRAARSGQGSVDLARARRTGCRPRSVLAAADIGACILDGRRGRPGRTVGRCCERWAGELTEVAFRAAALPTARMDAQIASDLG